MIQITDKQMDDVAIGEPRDGGALLDRIVARLKESTGLVIPSADLARDFDLNGRFLRDLLHYARSHQDIPVVGTYSKPFGYKYTEDPEEIRAFIHALKGRIISEAAIIRGMKRALRRIEGDQIALNFELGFSLIKD